MGYEENEMSDMLSKMIDDITKQKEMLVINRIEELGIQFDLEELKKPRRFTRFLTERHPDGLELYYYDNYTDNGVFIIGFKEVHEPFKSK